MTATSIPNPNASWLNTRGMWLGYLTSVAILHFILMSVPFISTPMAWTLTHVIHNVVSLAPAATAHGAQGRETKRRWWALINNNKLELARACTETCVKTLLCTRKMSATRARGLPSRGTSRAQATLLTARGSVRWSQFKC